MKVVICLATFNPNPQFLLDQIRSLIEQTYKDWILLILDDGSTQESWHNIQTVSQLDLRIQLLGTQINQGPTKTFETLLKKAALLPCEWIFLCDQDDVWQSDKISKMLEFVKSRATIPLLAHHDLRLVSETLKEISPSCWNIEARSLNSVTLESLVLQNLVTGCSALIHVRLLQNALPFPSFDSSKILHDHWLAAIAFAVAREIPSCKLSLMDYRQHANNVVGAQKQQYKPLQRGKIFHRWLGALKIRLQLLSEVHRRMGTSYVRRFKSFVLFFVRFHIFWLSKIV